MDPEGSDTTTTTNANPTARDIAEQMPLVHGVVAGFVRKLPRSVPREDLVAAGTVGLFFALRSSSHSSPEMFATYARIRIRGAIVDELRRLDWSPRRRRAPGGGGSATAEKRHLSLVSDAGADPAAAEAPARERVQVVRFDDLPPQEADPAEEWASPLEGILERRAHEALHAAVAALPPREREIVSMRYFQGVPSKTIARLLGLSEARVSQLHARATSRLRESLSRKPESSEIEIPIAA